MQRPARWYGLLQSASPQQAMGQWRVLCGLIRLAMGFRLAVRQITGQPFRHGSAGISNLPLPQQLEQSHAAGIGLPSMQSLLQTAHQPRVIMQGKFGTLGRPQEAWAEG